MRKNNLLSIAFILLLLTITSISAQGLTLEPSSFNINKTYGANTNIEFIIKNTKTFDFYNITFQDNDVISMPEILKLTSGSNATVTATIKGDEDLDNMNFSLLGYYEGQYGEGDVTHQVTINDAGEVNLGHFSVYVGDKINFTNLRDGSVFIKIAGSDGINIASGESYLLNINNADDFEYYFYESVSFNKVSNVYTVTALPTEGLITNPEFNPELKLNLNVEYPKTSIELTIMDDSEFVIDPFEETDVILSIKNTGDKAVRNLKISGEWISSDINNININPGITKGIILTIAPAITSTNETNKSYNKTLKVSGNFDSKEHDFKIFVPYTEIEEGEFTQGQTLLEWIESYCEDNPSHNICQGKTRYIYANGSENISIETGNKQFQEFVGYVINKLNSLEQDSSQLKELTSKVNEDVNSSLEESKKHTIELTNLKEGVESDNDISSVYIVFTIVLFIIFILILIIKKLKDKNKLPAIAHLIWKKKNQSQ